MYLTKKGSNTGKAALEGYVSYPALTSSDRLLVVAPHLDDETLGVGGLIAQSVKSGAKVNVVFLTNGDDFPLAADVQYRTGYPTPEQMIDFGKIREAEARKAVASLGVSKENLYFLGLPDRGLLYLTQAKFKTHPYTAPGTMVNKSPYASSFIKELPYTGAAAENALSKVFALVKPTQVLVTAPEDRHTDHKAAAIMTEDVLKSSKIKTDLGYYLVHYTNFPYPKGVSTELYLDPPSKLANLRWQVVYLNPESKSAKIKAVNAYQSQLRLPQIGKLMRSLVRQNELILPK